MRRHKGHYRTVALLTDRVFFDVKQTTNRLLVCKRFPPNHPDRKYGTKFDRRNADFVAPIKNDDRLFPGLVPINAVGLCDFSKMGSRANAAAGSGACVRILRCHLF
jgi:hypothetical protein